MTDNRFKLFRLPFLALCKLFELYDHHEIIQISLCSKRSLKVAKQCWKKKGKIHSYFLHSKKIPKINLYFFGSGFYYRFVILEEQDLKDQQVHNIRIGDAVVPSIHKDHETITFWKDKIFGIENIVNYIKDLFDAPISKIELRSENYENEFIDTINSIMKIQESVQDCTLNTIGSMDECLTHLLDNCKITGELSIYGQPTRQLRNDWNIQLDSIYIREGLFLTFQNLTNIDCKSLEVRHTRLTSEDANQFLKHWQNGGSSRIRYAAITIYSMKHDIVTSGIETVPQPNTLHRSYPLMRNSTIIRSGGLDIQRNDGTTGTVYMVDNSFDFGVDPNEVFRDREDQ